MRNARLLLVLLLVLVLGCHSPAKAVPAPPQNTAGPQVSSQPAATPKIQVQSAGPATVEAPTRADTSTEAARPDVSVAPKAEVTGQMFQELTTRVKAQQESINAAGAAIAGLKLKVGAVEGDLTTTAQNYEMSANQLAAFNATLQSLLDAQKQAMAAQARSDAAWRATMTGILIGLGGAVLIALAIGAPATWWIRVAEVAGGGAMLAAGLLRYLMG